MRDDEAVSALSRLRFRDHEADLRLIVAELRRIARDYPKPSEDPRCTGLFLLKLAMMLDPRTPASAMRPKLVVKQCGRGAPAKRPGDSNLGLFMWAHADVLDEKYEAVVARASEAFGVGKTAAKDALAEYRRFVQDNAEIQNDMEDRIRDLHTLGDLDGRLIPQSAG